MITIDSYTESDRETVLALHKECFSFIDGQKGYPINLKTFEDDISEGNVLVAHDGDAMMGFIGYTRIIGRPGVKQHIENILLWASNKAYEPQLLEAMVKSQKAWKDIGVEGEAVAKIYDIPPNTELKDKDIYLTDAAIRPEFRRRSIATRLTKRVIELSKQLGAQAIYADCWTGGHSSGLYRKLGFLPILTRGPSYCDGSACTVMMLQL